MNDKRSKLVTCYQLKYGNGAREQTCDCANRKQEPNKYCDERALQRLQKESEDELERARKMLKKTENVVKQSRKGCSDPANKTVKKPPSKQNVVTPHAPCKPSPVSESREAIKRLAKVAMGKACDCADGKSTGRSSGRATLSQKLPVSCAPQPPEQEKISKELPKKPKLTTEELSKLLDQEAKDVESAWFLTSETKESYKKPCPKQQKAREAVRALIEPKKEEPPPCPPPVPKEPLPFFDPDPDDISPEVAANMMYTQERGIKMSSCPEETVRHLFAEQLGHEEKEVGPKKDGAGDEILDSDLDEADVDDSVFTRNMSQRESGSKYYDAESTLYDKKTEFVLQEKEAKCVNRVQLRGNCAPWFPGYFVAFPDQVGETGIQVAKSPSGVFQKAWTAAKPNSVPPDDLYLLE